MTLDILALKQQSVTTLEGSKKLFELGVPQVSMFYWNANALNPELCALNFNEKFVENGTWKNYAAFTITELGEYLKDVKLDVLEFPAELSLANLEDEDKLPKIFDPHYWEKVLIYVLEQKLLELPAAI